MCVCKFGTDREKEREREDAGVGGGRVAEGSRN